VVACSVVYLAVSIAVICYWVWATGCDPSDPTVAAQREAEAKGEMFDTRKFEYMCEVCRAHVLSDSKHCGSCNRCVDTFDHHCRWINNCVGKSNYMLFFKLICLTVLQTFMHLVTSIVNVVLMMAGHKQTLNQVKLVFGVSQLGFSIALLVACFFNLLAVLFLGHLVHFHIKLQ